MIEQLRVKLPNRPGTLERMVSALAEAGVDMKALQVSVRGGGEAGEANLIVSDLEKASRALEASGHELRVEQALAVEMDDRVGGLAAMLRVLADEGVNVQQLYAFVTRVQGKSLAMLSVDDLPRAKQLLRAKGFHLMSRKALERDEPPGDTTLGDHLGADFIW